MESRLPGKRFRDRQKLGRKPSSFAKHAAKKLHCDRGWGLPFLPLLVPWRYLQLDNGHED